MAFKKAAFLSMMSAVGFCWLVLCCAKAGKEEAPLADMGPFFKPGAVRVLVLSGHNNHDWRSTTPLLEDLLEDCGGRFDVRVNESPIGLSARTLAPYDLLVLDYMGPDWGAAKTGRSSSARSSRGSRRG